MTVTSNNFLPALASTLNLNTAEMSRAFNRPFTTAIRHLQKQSSIPASYYRGGTSRALIFNAHHLPPNRTDWTPIFLGTIGSPDPYGRQLDGMGGGISSLSKICVVKPSQRPDAQVEFTFVQVGVKDAIVDYAGNCGNMTSAIGPFVVDSGLIKVEPPTAPEEQQQQRQLTVKLYNTNTDKIIHATFPICDGEAVASGTFSIDGVAGTGSKVRLDFIDPAGSKTGSLLPTGNRVDTIMDGIRATCIDVGNPCIFVPAEEILSGTTLPATLLPDEIQSHPELLSKLETIRRHATVKMGMSRSLEEVPPSIPKICLVSRPSTHRLSSGEVMDERSVDVVARAISTQQPHKALPITTGLALSAAARMEGTVVAECLRSAGGGSEAGFAADEVVIGHPSGRLVVGAKYDKWGVLERATVFRTARRLMEGRVFWK